jgi:DNA-binding SARP family transcriptional activator
VFILSKRRFSLRACRSYAGGTMATRKSLLRHSAFGSRAYLLITLGAVSLTRVAGATALVGPGKLLGLISHLTCRPARRSRTEQLVEFLWPERDSDTGYHDLRQAIWQIRRRLGRDAIRCGRGEVMLSACVESDRERFLAAVENGELEKAVNLYGGEFLPGCCVSASPAFEDWLRSERFRLARLFQHTAEALARRWLSEGRCREAVDTARRARDTDPSVQEPWRLVIQSLLAAHNGIQAVTEADLLERYLAESRKEAEPSTSVIIHVARRAIAEHPLSS